MYRWFKRNGSHAVGISPVFMAVFVGILGFQPIPARPLVPAVPVVELVAPERNSLPVARTVPMRLAVTVPPVVHARLRIPRINVDALIRNMGFTPEGAMAVPGNRVDVGWFGLGTRVGETGSAVIGGHNRWSGGSGVFYRLDELQIGDTLSVTDVNGTTSFFIVREMRTYAPTDDATDIFSSASGTHLNLITCSGEWDAVAKSYTKRLVLFTDLVELVPVV